MKLNLEKALVVFDLETTGLDIINDRIIQISYIKVFPDGKEDRKTLFVNPEAALPPSVSQLTGISAADLENAPTFRQLAPQLAETFRGCDFAGFNSNHFDIPLLAEEFHRANVPFDFSQCRFVDVQTIFHKMERRNLAAAYEFYCGRKMEDDFQAHRADQDTEATYRVLQGQLDMYNPSNPVNPGKTLTNDIQALAEFSKTSQNIDFAGRIVWKEKTDSNGNIVLNSDGRPIMEEVFNFGKNKGKSVAQVLKTEPNFYDWMMKADFASNTKEVLTRIKLKYMKK